MGNVILGLLLIGYIVVTIVNLVIEVKRDKETRPLIQVVRIISVL